MAVHDEFGKVADGDQLDDGYFNEMINESMSLSLLNNIRTLIDRAGVYSANSIDVFSEAYIDADGRNDYVATTPTTATFDTNKYAGSSVVTSLIYHDVPSGTFGSTISAAIGITLVEDWETGASVRYKLINSGEDTGWLDTGEISSFTAFTSEPTTSIVQLVPKSAPATTSYPSVRGFAVRAV
jgi:hypothetical protein